MLIISSCTMDSVECTGKGRGPCLSCRINWSRTDNKYFQRGSARLYQNIASVLAAMEAIKVSCNSICLGTIYCCTQKSEQWRLWKCKMYIVYRNSSQGETAPSLRWDEENKDESGLVQPFFLWNETKYGFTISMTTPGYSENKPHFRAQPSVLGHGIGAPAPAMLGPGGTDSPCFPEGRVCLWDSKEQ